MKTLSTCALCVLALSACSDVNDADNALRSRALYDYPDYPDVPPPGPSRGTLLQDPPELRGVVSAASLLFQLGTEATRQLLLLDASPLCDVAVYRLRYSTVGGTDESTTASGALMVPTGGDARCTGARPALLYAHGTSADRAYDISNLQNQDNAEGILLASFFAAQGYIVVAPNYAGYDTSTLPYHPFLVADQQSKDMIDALVAARSALPVAQASGTTDSGRLFVTGYSQGGHVAMATQRALQDAGVAVAAGAPMSGPYALAAFGDAVFNGQVNGGAPTYMTMLATAYQKVYGNIYATPEDVFEARYASGIENLLPSLIPRSDLVAQGKLPASALFSSTPPDPSYADITPATQPANLAPVFAAGFGTDNLVTNGFRQNFLTDQRLNPDGGWPTITTGVAAATPGLPLRQALKQNDLRNWTPTAPTLLCGGNLDPAVFWLNTQLMQGYWESTAPTAPVDVLDVDSVLAGGEPYDDLKGRFELAKAMIAASAVAQGATDGGARAVLEAYHTTLVAPFCIAAASRFFGTI